MRILYWTLCAILNAGSLLCLWTGLTAGGKNFLVIPLGAFFIMLPLLGMLIWTIMSEYYIGFVGLAVPAMLVLWGVFAIVR